MPGWVTSVVGIAPGLSALIAAMAFAFGVFSYSRQNALRRFEEFYKMREFRLSNEDITEVIKCLQGGDLARLEALEKGKKYRLLSFYEEIALMHESGLIRTSVAHYMFGYTCVRCLESQEFWKNIGEDKSSYYWSLYFKFANLMKRIEREELGKHAKLSLEQREQLSLSKRPSWAFWRAPSQLRF
jgi:hypothetical protein